MFIYYCCGIYYKNICYFFVLRDNVIVFKYLIVFVFFRLSWILDKCMSKNIVYFICII